MQSPIVIIGAGASGLLAAIAASRARPRSVLLLEKEARVGRKLLATGNGRCNLLNTQVHKGCFHGSGAHIAHEMISQTPPDALLALFASLGLRCREEAEGRVYPYSGQASAVLDILRLACARLGVQTRTDTAVQSIQPHGAGFLVVCNTGNIEARQLIIAGGGKASPTLGSDGSALSLLASLGHTITPLHPALAPLKMPPDRIRGLKGIRAQAGLALYIEGKPAQREQGEVLFTDYGLSGVAAMQLARRVNIARGDGKSTEAALCFLSPEEAGPELSARAALFAGEPLETLFTGLLNKRIGLCLLREASLSPQAPITPAAAARLAPLLSDWRLPVTDTQPFANAQVTAGGAILSEFDGQTLESLLVPGLYACGEALDVDGGCGGYNLMWAWLSGLACGQAAANAIH